MDDVVTTVTNISGPKQSKDLSVSSHDNFSQKTALACAYPLKGKRER